MRRNLLKEKLQRGETAYGVLTGWPSAEIVELFGHLGYDWVFIDAEHGSIGIETCAQMSRAADATGMTALVRVPENSPGTILGYLETGVMGVIIPHIQNADDARAAVDAVRYPPVGHRGAGSSTRLANYGITQTSTEYFEWANENVLIYGMIEDLEGVRNLDDILAVEGLDIVEFGPGDLAMDMGYFGNPGHPEVQKVVAEAREKIQKVKPGKLVSVSPTAILIKGGREFLSQGS